MRLILFSVLVFLLVVWSITLALTVLRSKPRQTNDRVAAGQADTPARGLLPRWLLWRESWDGPAGRAGLFAAWVVLVYGLLLILALPAVLIRMIWLLLFRKKHKEHSA